MFWAKPGNPRGGRREGRMGERDGGARPKPAKQLVTYKIQMCWAVSHENNN